MNDEQMGMTDEQIIAIVRGDLLPNNDHTWSLIRSMAEQLLKHRRRARGDSRRGEQFRKLRWSVEHVMTKMEELTRAAQLEDRQLGSQLIEVCNLVLRGGCTADDIARVHSILHAVEVEHG